MRKRGRTMGVVLTAALAVMLTTLGFTGTASAKLTGEFTKFQQCPYAAPEIDRCVWAQTTGGEVVLGNKKVPITNPAVLQGGYTHPNEAEGGFAKFIAAKNGESLTKAPQKVPGGLAGLVNCTEIGSFILRTSCEWTFENGITGVNSTLELARPASEIRINELNLALGEGVAMKLPVRAHLENPFLGSNCYVGSSASPLRWELRTDTTSPPPPNKPITGNAGEIEFLEEAQILEIKGAVLVDNAWSAPGTSGCGGIFSFLLDPIVSASSGLPSAAGNNTAILNNRILEATAFAVKLNDEENP